MYPYKSQMQTYSMQVGASDTIDVLKLSSGNALLRVPTRFVTIFFHVFAELLHSIFKHGLVQPYVKGNSTWEKTPCQQDHKKFVMSEMF